MNMRRAVLGAGMLCVCAVGGRAEDAARLTLSAGQTEFLRQEPILVTLRAATSLPAAPGGDSAANLLRFEVEPAIKARKDAKPLPGELQDATAQTRRYDLLEWFEFPAAGTFTVRAVYENAGSRLVSAPISVTLRAPKKGDPDFDAVARIHHVPWSNYEKNAYCGDTFDVVKRWPDSKLAPYCQYWNGRYSQQQKEYAKAIASYENLIAKYPGFPLADDARGALATCRALSK